MKKILISVPSRDKPEGLKRVIDMVYDTAKSKKNFDLQIIIDSDQVEDYKFLEEYKDLIIEVIEPNKESWLNIITAQNNQMKKGYYFFSFWSDDLKGLEKYWDEEMLKCYKAFPDDLFVCYTEYRDWGRSSEIHERCYTNADAKGISAQNTFLNQCDSHHEPNPIVTYKWMEFLYPFFEGEKPFKYGREHLTSQLLRLLKIHGYHRHVRCGLKYATIICDNFDTPKKFEQYFELTKQLAKGRCEVLFLLIGEIENYIKKEKVHFKEPRKRVFQICYENKNPHLASSLSCLKIIEDVYKDFDFDNDVFILSKGHACPALYAVLEKYNFHPNVVQRHPDIDVNNGISCTTGSLGHGLPIGVGMALAKKLKKENGNIYVLMGDKECQAGTTQESQDLIQELKLNNITILIDFNETKKEYPHVYTLTREEYEKNTK